MHKTKHHIYDLKHDLARMKDAIYEATGDVKDKAGELLSHSVEGVKNNTIDLRDHVSAYVKHKPLKSVGIALLSGIILGFLIKK